MSELYTKYATEQYVDDNLNIGLETKADAEHNHDSSYDIKGAANTALNSAKEYADTITAGLATEEYVDNAVANNGSVQPDWNQTDESANDYIKNKPFGEGGDSKLTLITSGIVTIENYQGIVNTDSSFLEQEIPYYVIFNNYYFPATYHNNDNYCGIGNASLYVSDGYNSGEPFFICAESSTSLGFYVINLEDDDYEFEIWADVPTIKTVDEKYLPVISIEKGGTGQTSIEDTVYTAARYRASSLHSTETTPTTSGVIAWTYE